MQIQAVDKETALDFAKRGARVILACYDDGKANQAARDIITETGSDKVLVIFFFHLNL